MPRKNKVKYTPAAIDDMDEIFSYIAQDNVFAAETLLEKLDKQISELGIFLNMGSVLSDDEFTLVERGYRFIVVHPYIVFYRFIGNIVIIHRVLHGRRDYLRELFDPTEQTN